MATNQKWTFEFIDGTTKNRKKIKSGITEDMLGGGVSDEVEKTDTEEKEKKINSFEDAFQNRLIRKIAISPLNSITGGLASPIYRLYKSDFSSAAFGNLSAFLAISTVDFIKEQIVNRSNEMKQEALNLNNTDNLLIRAGAVSKATYYKGNFFGIKSKTDRS